MTEAAETENDAVMRRYIGFLLQEMPKLAEKSLIAPSDEPHNRTNVLDDTISKVGDHPGLRLEFGVWRGNSIRRCAERFPTQHWYGFDSFEGFPDDGRVDWQKPFKVIELPDTPKNVTLVKGYFSETLDPFLIETPGEVAFVNVDCDIYSSTVDIFTALEKHDRLKPGLVIYFDELINYADYMWNEALALFEMLERTGLGVEWLSCDHRLRLPETSATHFHDGDHPTWNEDIRNGYWVQAACVLTDKPVDCGPLGEKDYDQCVTWVLSGIRKQEERRQAALDERNRRLEEQERERERRYVERKKLEKQRQLENLERRRREKAAAQQSGDVAASIGASRPRVENAQAEDTSVDDQQDVIVASKARQAGAPAGGPVVAQPKAARLASAGNGLTYNQFMQELTRRSAGWTWMAQDLGEQLEVAFSTHSPFRLDISATEVATWMRDAHKDGWTIEPLSCLVMETLIEMKGARTALDIGTHFGFISTFLLRLEQLQKVHGIEMNPCAVEAVERHLALPSNQMKFAPEQRYQMHWCALSDKDEPQATVWYSGMRLSFKPHPQFTEAKMDVRSLTSIVEDIGGVPDFIKIDIEGYEGKLVESLDRLLETSRPTVLMELHWDEVVEIHGATRVQLLDLFLSRGYSAARLNWHQRMPRQNFGVEVTVENAAQMLKEKNHAMYVFF